MFWEVFFANAVTRAVALGFALWVAGGVLARMADRMLAAACGFLLAAALGHLIPEAFESAAPGSAGALAATMIGAALFFLLFSRLTASAHVHGRLGEAHAIEPAPLLAGGMLHGFADGVLVAASFLADERTGWLIALAVLFHEFPQQVGYLTVLRSAGMSRRRSAVFCTVIAFSAVAGGMAGVLASSFQDSYMAHWNGFFEQSMVEEQDPDVFVLEVVERRLDYLAAFRLSD